MKTLKKRFETIDEHVRDDSEPRREFEVKLLRPSESGLAGKLFLSPEKLVFESIEVFSRYLTMEVAISKIRDVRVATEKDRRALRVFLLGATLGTLFKKKQKMLAIDFEDEFGIIQHQIFEGDGVETAIEELNGNFGARWDGMPQPIETQMRFGIHYRLRWNRNS